MASAPLVQYALKSCEKHKEKELSSFCKTCYIKICSSCLKEDHITHDWDLITEYAKAKRRQLSNECERLRAEDIAELRRQVDVYDTMISELQCDSAKSEDELDKERKSHIDEINKTYDAKLTDSRKFTAETIKQYNERKEKLQQKLLHLHKMTKTLGTKNDTIPDHDLIEMEQEMIAELDKAQSYNAEKYSHCNGYVPGEIGTEAVVGLTGEIYNVSVEEKSTFKSFSSPILTVAPESEDSAWIHDKKSKIADLITESGEKLKRLSIECTDLTVLQNGTIALTRYIDREITVLSNEEVIQKISTKPLQPQSISKTEKDEILVTLKDGDNPYILLPSSRRVVQRMTISGKVLHVYEFEQDGKTRLFTLPVNTVENKNTDVCVVNRTGQTSSHLVVLHRDGRVKFTYRGKNVSLENFLLFDVECDSSCRIIVSERWSKSLHLLSSCGKFIGNVRSFDFEPWSIALRGGKLWVGLHDGTVKVYIYKT